MGRIKSSSVESQTTSAKSKGGYSLNPPPFIEEQNPKKRRGVSLGTGFTNPTSNTSFER